MPMHKTMTDEQKLIDAAFSKCSTYAQRVLLADNISRQLQPTAANGMPKLSLHELHEIAKREREGAK